MLALLVIRDPLIVTFFGLTVFVLCFFFYLGCKGIYIEVKTLFPPVEKDHQILGRFENFGASEVIFIERAFFLNGKNTRMSMRCRKIF